VSLNLFTKRILIAGILTSAVTVALAQPKPPTPAPGTPATPPAGAAAEPATTPAAPTTISIPPVIAAVNGTPITSGEFIPSLYVVAGPRVLEKQLNLLCAKDSCRLKNVKVDEKEIVKAEHDNLIKNILANAATPPKDPLKEEDKQAIFNQIAQNQGMTRLEFEWQIATNAYLRALGKAAVDDTGKPLAVVTSEDLNDRFQVIDGDRNNVRVYVFKDLKAAQEVVDASDKQGRKFNEVADEKKIPWQGVVIPTDDSVKFNPAIFKDITKQKKEGEKSAATDFKDDSGNPIEVILFIDKHIPKTVLTTTQEADEKAKIKAGMQDAIEVNVGQGEVNKLRANGQLQIVVNDPIMGQYINQMREAAQKQAAQKAGVAAPGTSPATPAPGAPAPATPTPPAH